jgi:hypothetical protein
MSNMKTAIHVDVHKILTEFCLNWRLRELTLNDFFDLRN